jgi:predicted type IV restriction endonuclease
MRRRSSPKPRVLYRLPKNLKNQNELKMISKEERREQERKANREKFAWAKKGFDSLNEAFGPLKVIKMVDEEGIVTRIK